MKMCVLCIVIHVCLKIRIEAAQGGDDDEDEYSVPINVCIKTDTVAAND